MYFYLLGNKDFSVIIIIIIIIFINYHRVIILNVEGTYSQNNKNNKQHRKSIKGMKV